MAGVRRWILPHSRIITLVSVLAAHVLALLLVRQLPRYVHTPRSPSVTTTVFLLPEKGTVGEQSPSVLDTVDPASLQSPSGLMPSLSTAITLPRPTPDPSLEPPKLPPTVNWDEEARRAAAAITGSREEHRALGPAEEQSPRGLSYKEPKQFGWSHSRINRIERQPGQTVVWINDRCAVVNFVLPFCFLGKMPVRGDLFEDMDSPSDEIE